MLYPLSYEGKRALTCAFACSTVHVTAHGSELTAVLTANGLALACVSGSARTSMNSSGSDDQRFAQPQLVWFAIAVRKRRLMLRRLIIGRPRHRSARRCQRRLKIDPLAPVEN
jgi:hypothetical protein